MLGAEHGGMNEVLADVFALTGDRKYLDLAQRFSHRALLEPLTRREDHAHRPPRQHADPEGHRLRPHRRARRRSRMARRRGVLLGHRRAPPHAWPSAATASASTSTPPDDFAPMLESREGPETCNTYNMLRLTELLFRGKPPAEYADYYERALYNHILSTQHPEHGGYVYFTPIRPRHYRVYSQPKECFWCCVGTGMENHGKHGQFVYAHRGDELFVNLFVASELTWPERGLTRAAGDDLPRRAADAPRAHARRAAPVRRCTSGTRRGSPRAPSASAINGQPWPARSTPSSYVAIDRDVARRRSRSRSSCRCGRASSGCPTARTTPRSCTARSCSRRKTGTEQLDGLVAGAGPHGAHVGRAVPAARRRADARRRRVRRWPTASSRCRDGRSRSARPALIRPAAARDLELVPFFRVHDSRYMIYWRVATPAAYERVVTELRETERARLRLEARTLDRVVPGEQQSEIDHGVRSEASTTGVTHGRPFRDAAGWFGYDLKRGTRARTAAAARHLSRQRARPPVRDPRGRSAGGVGRRSTDASRIASPTSPIRFPPTSSPPTRTACSASASSPRPARAPARVYDVRLVRPE